MEISGRPQQTRGGTVSDQPQRPASGLQSVRPATVLGHAARQFVDQSDLSVTDEIVHVAPQHHLSLQRQVQSCQEARVLIGMQLAALQGPLQLVESRGIETDVSPFPIGRVIDPESQVANDLGITVQVFVFVVGRTGDHEGDPRLINQNRIGLIDDGEMKPAVHDLSRVETQLIAQ